MTFQMMLLTMCSETDFPDVQSFSLTLYIQNGLNNVSIRFLMLKQKIDREMSGKHFRSSKTFLQTEGNHYEDLQTTMHHL